MIPVLGSSGGSLPNRRAPGLIVIGENPDALHWDTPHTEAWAEVEDIRSFSG